MWHTMYKYRMVVLAVLLLGAVRCRKPFEPTVFKAGDNYLVIDGFININAGGVTSILLSRTANVDDSAINTPELNAQMAIESNNGQSYPMSLQSSDGTYASATLSLDPARQYRIFVKTANGSQYRSDFATSRPTPAIDSLNWIQNQDVTIYVNTHDPANNTIYYRWAFTETWQYESLVYSEWGVDNNNMIYHRDSATQQIHECWMTTNSNPILLGSSAALNQDVISMAPITKLLFPDGKLDIRYSILVKQYALTADAYNYWKIIQKNTEQLGGLFDEQPSQLVGNIHCLNNPNEPVIGYITATNLQQKRIFISNKDLQGIWKSTPPDFGCQLRFTYQNPTNFAIYDYPDKTWVPVYFQSGGGLAIAFNKCVDCTLQGGVNRPPAFW